jgi:hypothetical protein
MKVCSNYFKILIVILLISVIIYLSRRLRERFIVIGKCNVEKDCDKVPQPIQLLVNTNNAKNKIKLTWRSQEEINLYYILMYKNNMGPYIIKPEISSNNEFSYDFLNPEKNVRYKFAVVGENDYGLGYVNNFTEAILTDDGLELKYLQDIVSKVVCNADGSFKITDKCIVNENVNAKIMDSSKEFDFDEQVHQKLIDDLEKKVVLKFNL